MIRTFDPPSNNCWAISKPVPRVAPTMQNGIFILYCRNRTESWPRRRLRLIVCWHRNLFPNRCFPDPADEKPGQEDAESDYRCAEGHAYANEQEDAPKRKVCDPVKDLFHEPPPEQPKPEISSVKQILNWIADFPLWCVFLLICVSMTFRAPVIGLGIFLAGLLIGWIWKAAIRK